MIFTPFVQNRSCIRKCFYNWPVFVTLRPIVEKLFGRHISSCGSLFISFSFIKDIEDILEKAMGCVLLLKIRAITLKWSINIVQKVTNIIASRSNMFELNKIYLSHIF